MELEQEVSEESDSEERDPYAVIEEADDPNANRVQVMRVKHINRVWIHIEPNGQDFYMAMNDALNAGLDAIMVFQRWARHE
jgi:hypothetical protein